MSDNREIARGLVSGSVVSGHAIQRLHVEIESALDAATERGRRQGWSADAATVERVARAICRLAMYGDGRHGSSKEAAIDDAWERYTDEARAAIAAIPAPPARPIVDEAGVLGWARAYWHLTKNMDASELADYDDELASEMRERRALAERMLFEVPAPPAGESDRG